MVNRLIKEKKIILASSSPRRKLLLEGLDIEFKVEVNGDISEDYDPEMDIELVPEHLARLKSSGFGRSITVDEILVTADTMVLCKGEILGKPCDKMDAVRMLRMLSGKMHKVLTGVCLRDSRKTT